MGPENLSESLIQKLESNCQELNNCCQHHEVERVSFLVEQNDSLIKILLTLSRVNTTKLIPNGLKNKVMKCNEKALRLLLDERAKITREIRTSKKLRVYESNA